MSHGIDQKYIDRFHAKVKTMPTGCVEWQGTLTGSLGYGQIQIGGRKNPIRFYTHRFSWLINNGPIPEDIKVLHRCDNPKCVNLEHLFLGTAKDNTTDMIAKGRRKGGQVSQFTEKDIALIKQLAKTKGTAFVAKKFEVSKEWIRQLSTNAYKLTQLKQG